MTLRRISAITLMILMFSTGFSSYADEEPTLIKMRATAYCLDGKTASGKPVREGICATGRRELIGKTCIVYQRLPNGDVGEMLYILEIEDCGCSENVVDIWQPDLDACQKVMDRLYERGCQGRIYCQILEDCNG